MNTRTPLIRAALAATLVGAAFTFTQTATVIPANAAVSMSVDARAPLHATLLPVVSVFADATDPDGIVAMRIAATEALPVTLLPTVYVSARLEDFTRVAFAARYAQAHRTTQANVAPSHASAFTHDDAARVELADVAPALRMRKLPR